MNIPILPNSCPWCGAGIVIGQRTAICDANKYASVSWAGDCRWTLTLTPDLRRQADEALEGQDYIETTEESERSSYERAGKR
jgi:hypothetical protein